MASFVIHRQMKGIDYFYDGHSFSESLSDAKVYYDMFEAFNECEKLNVGSQYHAAVANRRKLRILGYTVWRGSEKVEMLTLPPVLSKEIAKKMLRYYEDGLVMRRVWTW